MLYLLTYLEPIHNFVKIPVFGILIILPVWVRETLKRGFSNEENFQTIWGYRIISDNRVFNDSVWWRRR